LDDKIQGDEHLLQAHLDVLADRRADVVHGAVIIRREQLAETFAWGTQIRSLDPAMIFMISANCRWEGMTLGVSTANMSIRREAYWRVGGMDEVISGRYDDIEFAYRLYRSGATMYFSHLPVVRNRRLTWGGAYHPEAWFQRMWRPRPHPNYLYFHRKHLPGWSTRQLILKQLIDVYWPSRQWLRRPWILVLTPVKVLRSVLISRRLLNRSVRQRGFRDAEPYR